MAIPHLKVPFQIQADGTAATVEQDSVDEVAQCVQNILLTQIGDRIEVPTYGVPNVVFTEANGAWSTAALAAVKRWEPRASVVLERTIDNLDELLTYLNISVGTASSVQQ